MSGEDRKKKFIRNSLIICLCLGVLPGILWGLDSSVLFVGLCFGLGLWLGILFEMIPWFIAVSREHKDENIIFWICLFFGWLLIPWLACIIWACQAPKAEQRDNNSNKYEDLEKLQNLKENGVISESEFEIEKQKLLR